MWALVERAVGLGVVALVLFAALRGHPFFAIPLRWRWLALRDAHVAAGLRLRAAILDLLAQGKAQHAELLVADIDELLTSMADLVQTRRALVGTDDPGPRLQQAIERTHTTLDGAQRRLEDLKATLLEQAALDAEATVEEARQRFRERAEDFGYTVEAQTELKAALQAARKRS